MSGLSIDTKKSGSGSGYPKQDLGEDECPSPSSPSALQLIRSGGALSSLIPKASNGERRFGMTNDQFQLGNQIAVGGQAQVHVCTRLQDGGEYAAKIISLAKGKKEIENLHREILNMSELHHERIINLHASFEVPVENPRICILVMDYAQFGDMWTKVNNELLRAQEKNQPFSGLGGAEICTKHVTRQMLEGIEYMHTKKIIHRDLKLENVLIVKSTPASETVTGPAAGRELHSVKIADLGYSRGVDNCSQRRSMSIVGTPGFAAPEVMDQRYGEPADLFSLGVMVYVMLCAAQPFQRLGPLYKKIVADIDSCPAWERSTEAARSFVRGLLEIEPENRLTVEGCLRHPWMEESERLGEKTVPLHRVASADIVNGVVQRICGYTGSAVDNVELQMSAGEVRHYGKRGGENQKKFPLEPGEIIIAVAQETRRNYLGNALVFYTSHCQVIAVNGSEAKSCERFVADADSQITGLQFQGSKLTGIKMADNPEEGPKGLVAEIRGKKGYCVDRIELHLRKSRDPRCYGGYGGADVAPFQLNPDEYITVVEQGRRDAFLGTFLAFYTSQGRIHIVQGMQAIEHIRYAAPAGSQICGLRFEGSRLSHVATCPRSGDLNRETVAPAVSH
eukprot:TRINITY_DN72922_c0_g1_i1.p1 TRINITY_DN72922_c0_g1~~TRINITY_DN72922_c0_g1_i1.p1  ORF type:complete len:621 (-),score=119.05 TRINITY_DN72922_c0_g1_i1:290-2152(-)